jgi:hypothetical protein
MKYESPIYDKIFIPEADGIAICERELGLSYSKYNNIKHYCGKNGQTFDSLHEYVRYCTLKALEERKEIYDLSTQVTFYITSNENSKKQRKKKYIADFTYMLGTDYIVEDVKHPKLMKSFQYGIKRQSLLRDYGGKLILVHPKQVFCRPRALIRQTERFMNLSLKNVQQRKLLQE